MVRGLELGGREILSVVVAGTTLAFLLVLHFDMTHCSVGVGEELWPMGTDIGQSVCRLTAKHFELAL